ncbi:MAG: DNA (cytosine-5-)-methyltransferase [Chitinophagales bacterium]|nr:DNA (cytosine-5-)-methyltransferase [Chitinophagales bacterium]
MKLKKNKSYSFETNTDSNTLEEPNYSIDFPVIEKIENHKTINVLSLFSGCGGMDLGLEGGFIVHKNSVHEKYNPDFVESYVDEHFVKLKSTKFKTVFANDILKEAKTAWIHNFGKLGYDSNVFHSESIVDLVKMHKTGVKIFPAKVDIVTGGFPCQDFSIAGKRNGFNSHKDHNGKIIETEIANEETRGKLYTWMKEVIEITKPKIFIAENVKGLVNLENVKQIIQDDFSTADENGYIVLDPQVLHAADYGVPQSRERVIFIGIRKSALKKSALKHLTEKEISSNYNPYPKASHAYNDKSNGLAVSQTLENILSLIEEPEYSSDPSQMFYSKAKFMGVHCQGQTEVNLKGISPTIRAEHHGNIEYRRLSKENGGKNENELKKGLKERRLTPRECGLIQTFPIDFEFVIPNNKNNTKFLLSPSGAYKVIGNAVPPLLAYHIAKRLEKLWSLYFK